MRAVTAESALTLLAACVLAACSSAHGEPGDASIFLDAATLDAGSDSSEPDAGAPIRLDVAACSSLAVPVQEAAVFVCAPSTEPGSDCAAPSDGPAFNVVGRDLCAEALASSDGHARVQFAPAVDVLEVSCDGLVLAARAGVDRVRVDFHGHAAIAEALANDAPFSVEVEATSGPDGCVATLEVRAPWQTIMLGELPATGGRLSFGTAVPPATIDVTPTYAAGASCLGANAACVTPSYDSIGSPIVVSLCGATVLNYACGDYSDFFAVGTSACGARLRVGATVRSALRICH